MAQAKESQAAGMTEAYDWRGRTVIDRDGEKIGKLDELYLDQETDRPEWALVNTGAFGTKSSFVPLAGAQPAGEDVRVAFATKQVKGAPKINPEDQLSQSEEEELYRYYGLGYSGRPSASSLPEGARGGSGTDDAMTRSEEELRVGKATREVGRARLRKYVVTEQVEETVPVRREEVRIEREPITDANVDRATSGPEISEEEHETVLREEEVVVEKRVVPKERVSLEKETVIEEQQVSEEVRKERIDLEDDR